MHNCINSSPVKNLPPSRKVLMLSVADAGLLEGGFHYDIVHKIFGSHAHF